MPNIEAESSVHVVAGIVRAPHNKTRFLIARRQKGKHLENLWEFPGGKVEPGESRFAALRRELQEEIGIEVIQARPFMAVNHRYDDALIYLDVWEILDYSGRVKGQENQTIRWIKPRQIDQFEFPAADKPILAALTLPSELLITPDVSIGHEEFFLQHFSTLMARKPYPLVQFRSHHLGDDVYSQLAIEMDAVCSRHGSELVINRSSFESYRSKEFDAFTNRHLNSRLLNALSERPFDDNCVLSASCHDAQELAIARRIDCRYVTLSTVRPTPSHPGRTAKGWFGFNRLARKGGVPVYALGGVRRRDLAAARYQGAQGVAGISDFWNVEAF